MSAQTTSSASPLFYADTASSPDLLYFGKFAAPDAFIAFGLRGNKFAVLNALEFGRGKKESAFDTVLPLEPLTKELREANPDAKPGIADVIALLAKKHRIPAFTVPETFPAGLLERLRARGVTVTVGAEPFLPEREVKTPAEIAAIREGNRCSALGIAAAERVLRAATIKRGVLHHAGSVLTSEKLKFAIEVACLEAGAVSADTIAAGGDQACDPHERGHGPLRANELIIVDVFPRVSATGYHGDMTRTFLKGRASDAQRKLVAAVREAQLAAFPLIRAGANGRDAHRACVEVFTRLGYETKHTPKGSVGFFHGTGHGLGLAVHELPRLSGAVDYTLPKNSVVTVEPGLYYPGLGGCRIEDVVQVTATKPKLLSAFHYEWELP